MSGTIQRSHAILMPSGTYHRPDLKHLYVVCTDKCEAGNHVLVSITGWTNDLCDGTTRLKKGDHTFIRKDSYMFYRGARIESAEIIQIGLDEGKFELHKDPISDELVKKIMDGLCKSIHTPRKVKKYADCPEDPKPKKKFQFVRR